MQHVYMHPVLPKTHLDLEPPSPVRRGGDKLSKKMGERGDNFSFKMGDTKKEWVDFKRGVSKKLSET